MNILCLSRAVGAVFALSDVCFAAKRTFRVFISPHRTPSPNMRRSDNTHRNTYRILRIFRPFILGTRIVFSEEPDASWRLSGRLRRCRLMIFRGRLRASSRGSQRLERSSRHFCAHPSGALRLYKRQRLALLLALHAPLRLYPFAVFRRKFLCAVSRERLLERRMIGI